MKNWLLILGLVLVLSEAKAQVPFSKGVNLTNWFQVSSARQIQFTKFSKQDFLNIKSLGCDVIRLPINLQAMTQGSPDYKIDPIFFTFLDSAVSWAEQGHIYLLLDNHSFDPAVNTEPAIETILIRVWEQMADHYKDHSTYIYYEVLNEPHGISTQNWGAIQQRVIDAIRAVDTKHTIVVGPSGYNSYSELNNLPVYNDNNLIYTFHFYDPFVFTHQGATWVDPSMAPLAQVPFPYDMNKMPSCPATLKGSWIENSLNNYSVDGTVSKVKSLIDVAVNFKNQRNVTVFCGEFGVYIPNSNNTDRSYWYEIVRKYLEEKGIPWTIWDYTGGFGLFTKGSNELFNYDLNIPVLQALGLAVPPQQVFSVRADSIGFGIYSDYIGKNINESSGGAGTIDFYSTNHPNNNTFCLDWANADQYSDVGFAFKPTRDLSKLVANNFALDFMVRGNVTGTKFDVRFIDTKTTLASDHPWRIRFSIDEALASMDKRWHHVRIPLKNFTEQGSWDNGAWFNPEGKFDWTAVDRFEIVAEDQSLKGKELWFDNVYISDQDTATVLENTVLRVPETSKSSDLMEFHVFPNPMKTETTIFYRLALTDRVVIEIYNSTGQKIKTLLNEVQSSGIHTLHWNGSDTGKNDVLPDVYFCRISTSSFRKTVAIVKE
jgi:endoglucanase